MGRLPSSGATAERGGVTAIDIVDETFIVAPVALLQAELCDEDSWKPLGLSLRCFDDRGVLGKRWRLTDNLQGTAEVWLEPVADGIVVHFYLQADPVTRRGHPRLQRRYSRGVKARILGLKREYDRARPAGTAAPQPDASTGPQHDKLKVDRLPNKES